MLFGVDFLAGFCGLLMILIWVWLKQSQSGPDKNCKGYSELPLNEWFGWLVRKVVSICLNKYTVV